MTFLGVNDLNDGRWCWQPAEISLGGADYTGKLVFAQVMAFAPWHTFRRLLAKYRGDVKVRSFTCLDQYLCMASLDRRIQREFTPALICIARRLYAPETGKTPAFLTNHFGIPAHTVRALYKSRCR